MTLQELAASTTTHSVSGDPGTEIADVCFDSRKAGAGALFVAVRGAEADGHRFVGSAVEAGCAAVLAEERPPEGVGVPWVHVPDSRRSLADVSAKFFGNPSDDLAVAGVTGTNGKTTVAFLLHHLASSAWRRCGLLGTVRYDTGDEVFSAARTTPESRDLQALLARMRDAGCRGVIMEVSSHALSQQRTAAVAFDVGIFTNLTQDHLDYHGRLDDYFEAKAALFEQMVDEPRGKRPVAVVNLDDRYGRRLVRRLEGRLRTVTFGLGLRADFRAVDLRGDARGTRFTLLAKGRSFLVRLPLIGAFNVSNALAALAAANALGLNLRESVTRLAEAPQVPGRLERVGDGAGFQVFVDYAHTPDALANVLATLRALEPDRLITVFGCGGDRDRAKRPLMGAAADAGSDLCIVTSDNPRSEDPGKILDDVAAGMRAGRFQRIVDREAAITAALGAARPGDIVLVAGKGHEGYQEVGGERKPFDDRQVVRRILARHADAREDAANPGETKGGGPR